MALGSGHAHRHGQRGGTGVGGQIAPEGLGQPVAEDLGRDAVGHRAELDHQAVGGDRAHPVLGPHRPLDPGQRRLEPAWLRPAAVGAATRMSMEATVRTGRVPVSAGATTSVLFNMLPPRRLWLLLRPNRRSTPNHPL